MMSIKDIPQEMAAAKRWVIWRKRDRNDDSGKFDKVPVYANGVQRHGKQNSEDDIAQMVTLDDAIAACKRHRADGVGFAFGPGCGFTGIDLDRWVEDGKPRDEIYAQAGGYAEVSPSGTGVRIILPFSGIGDFKDCPAGVEVFEEKGFCTITGNTLRAGPMEPASMGLVELLRSHDPKQRKQPRSRPVDRPDPPPMERIEEALSYVSPSCPRADWIEIAMALHSEGVPFEVFHQWSQRGDTYQGEKDCLSVWNSLNGHGVTIATLFKRAKDSGWTYRREEHAPTVAPEDVQEAPDVPAEYLDYWAYLPEHKYIYVPTGALWPASSINSTLPQAGRETAATTLDNCRAVHQMTWSPGDDQIIEGKLVVDGGWVRKKGARTFNLYRAPIRRKGNPGGARQWAIHLEVLYGADSARHITCWLAHRIQHPGVKLNHALVLGGGQGIGKDTLLEPVKRGVGEWNWAEVSPAQMLGRFNGWVKSVVLRINEGRDLGDVDRFTFYDHTKTYIAAPPEVLRVDEKNIREYSAFNKMGVIITTNHKLDGLYLPPDDRRHYVAWSDVVKEEFSPEYWRKMWAWYESGGSDDVIAYLESVDLSGFDPKAPAPRTEAFEAIVMANHAPDELDLADLLDQLHNPAIVTLPELVAGAKTLQMWDLVETMQGARNARKVPHRLERAGYEAMKNPNTKDGRWKVQGKNSAVYGLKTLTTADRYAAMRKKGIQT